MQEWRLTTQGMDNHITLDEHGGIRHVVCTTGLRPKSDRLIWQTGQDICSLTGVGWVHTKVRHQHEEGMHELSLEQESDDGVMARQLTFRLEDGLARVHVLAEFEFRRRMSLNTLRSTYEWCPDGLEFSYAPAVRPNEHHVIGQHVFRSPAVIWQKDDMCGALVPDLHVIQRQFAEGPPALPYCIHVEAGPGCLRPEVGYGFQLHDYEGHVYYKYDPGTEMEIAAGTRLKYGFTLFAIQGQARREGYRTVVEWMWNSFATPCLRSMLPQTVPLERYAHYGLDYAIRNLWTQRNLGGKQAGYFMMNRELPLDVQFQAWFNQMRTACGLAELSRQRDSDDWRDKSEKIKNVLLSAPQSAKEDASARLRRYTGQRQSDIQASLARHESNNGAFPTVFYQLFFNSTKYPGWRASTRQGGGDEVFHTTDMSWAAYWLLRWHCDVQEEEEIVIFCECYGKFLLEKQLPSGAIPSWIQVLDGTSSDVLRESAQSSVSGLFLAMLGSVTGNRKYVEAAGQVKGFLEKEVIPACRWLDFEVFFSCSPKPLDFYDDHTRQYGQNNLVIHWTAELYKQLYIIDGDRKLLEKGCVILDYLSLFQQIWDAPFLSVYTFGGFGVQNSDAEWNDARQGVFAETYGDYYLLTGREEYLQRAVYAARASFLTMNIPENQSVYPFMDRYELGHAPENYAHNGDRPAGASGFDWQVGSGLAGWAFLRKHFGDLYIDFGRRHAVGINGCVVMSVVFSERTVQLDIDSLSFDGRKPLLHLSGLDEGSFPLVIINGVEAAMDWEIRNLGKSTVERQGEHI